ncbi:MAG: RNA methyltransferase [Candidatus Diapherotrites archaeon]|nr:RNA methyltransferase [Candidatus Diapherotrites archaeon]
MSWTIILVEPENPGTIGFVARAMNNFSLSDLVLVNPCDMTAMTRARAMHSTKILEKARTVKTFSEAVTGFDEVIATTAKPSTDNNTTRSYLTPRELASARAKGRYALVFGRESRGLTNKELRACDTVVHIECPGYRVMNITHAAAIVFYELFSSKASTRRQSDRMEKKTLVRLFTGAAESSGLRNPENAVKMFRNVVSRAFISGGEAKGIAVVLSRLRK